MRVLLDTNVIISGILFGGVPNEVLRRGLAGEFVDRIVTGDRDLLSLRRYRSAEIVTPRQFLEGLAAS